MSNHPEAKESSTKERVRATRYVPGRSMAVSSKTIGTAVVYTLSTENVSRSGLLLSWQQKRPIPFIENTIIEMTIDPAGEILAKPVACLGKVVRKTSVHGGQGAAFGIQIVQIESSDQDVWEKCLKQIAASGAEIVQVPAALLAS